MRILANMVLLAIMQPKSIYVTIDFELNQAGFRVPELLPKFLANVAEVMLLTVVPGQGIVIVSFVIPTMFTSWMSIALVVLQVSPFVKLLFKW